MEMAETASKRIDRMKQQLKWKTTEALRKPSVKMAAAQVMVSYSSATSLGEEIARRFKTLLLPQITNLCNETESFYNTYSTTAHEEEKEAKKQIKELKPVEDVYNTLMKAQDIIVNFIAGRKKSITEQTRAPVGTDGGMPDQVTQAPSNPQDDEEEDQGTDIGGVERLMEVIHKLAGHNDLHSVLGRIQDPDSLADELEGALNAHESELNQDEQEREF